MRFLDELYTEPVLEGLPAGTRFVHDWAANRDVYRFWLASYSHDIHTVDELTPTDFALAGRHSGAFIALLQRRIEELRMRHYFACVYARGGYC